MEMRTWRNYINLKYKLSWSILNGSMNSAPSIIVTRRRASAVALWLAYTSSDTLCLLVVLETAAR